MIPKAPPLPPRIKPSGAPVVFEAVDTPFLSKEVRDNLEFHVKRKKLQHQWGLPMMVQESLNAFIPPAPKLIVSELNPKPQYQIVVEVSDLPFISEKHRKDVEFNIKRRIIHRRWGYPKFVIMSLKSMCPPASIAKDLLQQKETESLTHSSPSEKGKALDKKPHLSVPAKGTAQNDSKLRAQDVEFSFKNRDPDVIDRFEVHLSMKCIAIKLEMIPKIVQHSYKICLPVVKIPLKKIIPPGVVFLQKRPDCIFFMEQARIDRIEMNLKHKRIENQWGVVTMYKKSMALMIPKAPPLPPRIKPSGAPVVFEAVDTPFLSKEVRDNLEFHVKRKKLQHQWGLPMMVQESLNAFIPAAPKLIASELNPKPQYQVVVELSDLSFISEKHRKDVEFNIKRKIIHRRWGYPKFVITSLKSMCPPASIAKDLLQQKETESLTHSSLSEKRKVLKALDKKPHLSVPAKGTAQHDSKLRAQDVQFSFKNIDPEVIDRFEVHLSMKCLAIRLEMIPKIVQHSYKICSPLVKIPLKKIIPPGVVFLQKRPDSIFFMEQPRIDRIEMNLKHKRIESQWGVGTMYRKSMALMIPKAPPLPPRIKPSGAPVVFEAVDTPFLSKEVRDNLEFHVKRKKLQHQWGLPMMVQESLNAFIPPAPKLIVSELNPKPQYQIVVELSDLSFISEKHRKDVEFNIKRKIIHRKWGYPKFVITSLKSMCPPASIAKDLLQQKEAESLTHSSLSEKRKVLKALDKKPHLSVPAKGTAQKDSKLRAQDVEFSFKNRDPDIIDRFEVHLSMKCLAIRLEMIPKIVQHSYKICLLVVKIPLKKIIPPGVVFLQKRPDCIFFMEQPRIDRIEMNLKHKRIENQWGVVTMYKKSMALMIPKAPPLPPRIKPSGAPVVFEAVDTPFLSNEVRDNLEFHVKRKKLQHQWGLPMMVQESLNAFIPAAPKLIVSELNPKPQYQVVVELGDLSFISEKHRKDVEFNIKRKIIHRRWGYPKFVITSLKSMCPPVTIAKDLLQEIEAESLTHSSLSEKRKVLKALDKKPHLSVPAKGTAQHDSKLRAQDVQFSFKNIDPEVIDRFEVHLSMKCLAIRLEMIPKIVQHSYEICSPLVKIPLKKIIPPGVVFLQKRPDCIFFMEQPRIDRIEMNLKHKRIESQWGVGTMYRKSMALMIPKAPPLPPRIKPSGAPVVFEAVDTPFLSKEVRDNLEFHVKRKKLQHQWGLPMMVQESLNAFIPPAPKLIVSELNPKPQYQIVVELSDLSFITEKHRKDVEFNIKRKIIHRRWGYPKFVITSLKSMCPPASIAKDLLQQKEAESLTHSSPSEKGKALDKKPHLSVPAKGTAQNDSKLRAQDVEFSFKNRDPDVIDRFEVHLSMKCLAIKLEMIPKIVQHSYEICSPVVKIPLKKIIPPGVVFLQKRPDCIFFMEQPRIDRIEMNLKHKRIENQWGVVTMYKKSMALMIPKAPPLPPRIKPSGAPVVFEAVDTPFLSKEVRDNLEFHVKRKKLQHQWGLPMMVQESLNAFIPAAPKLIVSELNRKPQYQVVVELSDLSFISEKHRKDVEFNIKRKIIHRRWGYPKFVITSLKSMCPPASIAKDLLQQKEAESLTHSSLSEKRKVLKALDKKPHLSVPAKGTAQKDSKLRAQDVEFSFKNRDPDIIDRFEVHLSMKCLAIRLEMIPKIVQHSYKICLPVVKIPLKKIIPPGVVFLQKRPDCIFFMEQPRIDRIEMNLKHKRIENQWGVVTMYKKSMALMIPKAPPLPPRIKPSGEPVVFEAVDTPFLSKEVRDNLEFHVKRKKLQHQWGLPMMVQESLNAFIPPAPKLIVSELNPKPQYQIVVELSDLSFISEKHRKDVEFNIKKDYP
ncbi:hypothetical protein HHUSO_G35462 [Huso huso]|uniref:SPATA31 domain-containing protein n=1 Tax=Huso huso TaxID=61971 RepID=A0ABR0Y431_HUSHU